MGDLLGQSKAGARAPGLTEVRREEKGSGLESAKVGGQTGRVQKDRKGEGADESPPGEA